jgi:hypothetical protein
MHHSDAVTTSEALPRQRRGEAVWPQCSLSAARNLLRREGLPASFLAERQMGMAAGQLDTAQQGLRGDIRFPDWPRVLRELLRDGEVFVRFNPQKAGASELLHDVRVMAMVFLANTHVVAVHRDEASVGGRVTFRKYDNDSDARRRGTFERVSARQLWVGSCEMVAITARGSALHRAVGEARPDGSLREQRAAELRSVLSGAGLGALLPVLQRAQIGSLAALKKLSVERLQAELRAAGGSRLTAAQRQWLSAFGLCTPVTAPCAGAMDMERV